MASRPVAILSRRHLLKSTAVAAGVSATLGLSPRPAQAKEALQVSEGATILFQGDSITDAGRDRKTAGNANNFQALGRGYPLLLASALLAEHPQSNLKIYNRGISGHKVPDLDKRWQADCIELKPSVLSILVGVNDIWHKLNGNYDGTVETYETGFADLLAKTKSGLPDVQIVVCEPFALRCGAVKDSWYPEFDERRAAAKQVAEKAGATWVPFQTMFDDAVAAGTQPNYWAGDGVHPTLAGHALMAKTWREVTGI